MKEKQEDIENIQKALWRTYKEFYEISHDSGKWRDAAEALINEYDGEMEQFSKNLVSSWETVIDDIAEDFRCARDTKEKFDCVKHIQNALWGIYKEFLKDKKMKEHTGKSAALVHQYSGKKDMMLFAQTLILSWTPVINGLAADFRAESGDDACK